MWPTVGTRPPHAGGDPYLGGRLVTGRTVVENGRPRHRYVHDALLYDSPEHLVDVAVPFLLQGLDAGEAGVVATSAETAEILRDAVDGDPRVHVLERGDVY